MEKYSMERVIELIDSKVFFKGYLASLIGMHQSNFSHKLKKKSFSLEERILIVEIFEHLKNFKSSLD